MSINKNEEKELEELASEFLSGPLEEEEDEVINDSKEENQNETSKSSTERLDAGSHNQSEESMINFTKIALDFALDKLNTQYYHHTLYLPCESYRVYTADEGPIFEKCICFPLVVISILYLL